MPDTNIKKADKSIPWTEQIDYLHANKAQLPMILISKEAVAYHKKFPSQFAGIYAKEVGQSWSAVKKYMASKGYFRKKAVSKKDEVGPKRHGRDGLVTELWARPAGEHYKHLTFEVMEPASGRTSLVRLLFSKDIVSKLVKSI